MSELKPCPFCGGKPRGQSVGAKNWCIYCADCESRTRRYYPTWEEACAAWNLRASGWISVKERLPEDSEMLNFYDDGRMRFTSVLCATNGFVYIINRMTVKKTGTPYLDKQATDGWVWGTGPEPTHWMPLLEPPEADNVS